MELTAEVKGKIDSMSYEELLRKWRFAPIGDPMFQGESGCYFDRRMADMRAELGGAEIHTAASKRIGWC